MSVTQETYRRIIATAGNVLKLTHASRVSSSNATSTVLDSPHMRLPLPLPIVHVLIDDGIQPEAAEKLSESFLRISEKLREKMESTIQSTWLRISEVPRHDTGLPLADLQVQLWKTHETIYNRKVKEWAENIQRQAKARITVSGVPEKADCSEPVAIEGRKPTFNHSFLPILESLFVKSQKPTRNEKLLLAERSGMTYKQIHVWFQNRRNRTKKTIQNEGSSDLELHVASQVHGRPSNLLRLDVANLRRMTNERYEVSSRSSSGALIEKPSFNWNAPPYAFPSTYPPTISMEEDPFPCCSGDLSIFLKPCWVRKPATTPTHQYEENMEVLTNALEKLRINDEPHFERPSKNLSLDITPPYALHPLRAPLVSLIRNFASCVVHRSGKPSDDVQRSQGKAVAAPTAESGVQSAQRKTRRRQAPASRGCAVSADQNSAPSARSPSEPTSFPTPNSSVATACILTMDQPSKVKNSARKSSSSQRVPVAPTSKRTKGRSAPIVKANEPSSEPPIVHPSPTASVDSLPSLSYSSRSSSASTCSQSPTTSFGVLPDNDLLPSLDPYQPSGSSLTLPLASTIFEDFPTQMFPPSDISFDFSKGPLDYTFDLGLPSFPSYSESFDSISQGLQSSPDFPPPGLTLDSFSFAG